jgi:transcriptional regulator with XRE-family HTH domain
MKLTELGKETRKIRIGRDEVLLDMAERLEMSPAMISAIETGAKPAPDDFVSRLAAQYEEVSNRRREFEHLAEKTKKLVKMPLEASLADEAKDAAVTFARVLPQLTPSDLAAIARVFDKYKKGMYDKKIEGGNM